MRTFTDTELFELLRYVNNEGAKGRRIITFQSGMSRSAGDGFWADFLLCFDSGPESAMQRPWPE